MPPPTPTVELCVTRLLLTVNTPAVPPKVPVAIPPPAKPEEFPLTSLRFNASVPPLLKIPPPTLGARSLGSPLPSFARPPVTVMLRSDRLPPGPSTSRSRTVWLPSMVAPLPFTATLVVTIGSPFAPLSAVVRVYVHPGARLSVPPPAEFTALTAATNDAWPPQGTSNFFGAAIAALGCTSSNAINPTLAPTARRTDIDLNLLMPLPPLVSICAEVSTVTAQRVHHSSPRQD